MMRQVVIDGSLIMMAIALLLSYRLLIYQCYRRFYKHIYFYQHKTYQRSSSYRGLIFWIGLYASSYVYCIQAERLHHIGFFFAFGSCFALMSSLDFKLQLVPLRLLSVLFALIVFYRYVIAWPLSLGSQVQMLFVLFILYYATRKGVGLADIYLLCVLSFLFPIEQWMWLILLASGMGLSYGLMLRLTNSNCSHIIAFVPWICVSAWLMLLLR